MKTVESASFGNRVAAKLGKCCPNEISPFVEIYNALIYHLLARETYNDVIIIIIVIIQYRG